MLYQAHRLSLLTRSSVASGPT
ncbi:uncharacterized protein CPUR_01064 [Claviceps purpurea 20.1]|uniref:Uncharacterized protein n=1 Tax=Claviceps purpurea (strain 20.1) TaxID=1111077 RepID=M1W2G5_CLAP2|nr:uncharacterized protein CPUR_01064 [Claviceps purpurea 20.1]